MTDYELAKLKLAAWKTLDGWGRTVAIPEDDPEYKLRRTKIQPQGFEERCAMADRMVNWALKPSEGTK